MAFRGGLDESCWRGRGLGDFFGLLGACGLEDWEEKQGFACVYVRTDPSQLLQRPESVHIT